MNTWPERDIFAVIIFSILLGVIVLQIGHQLGNLQARVANVEGRVSALEAAR